MNGAVNAIEERDAIRRDLGRVENWAHENIITFNKVNCKVLNLGWQNSRDEYSLEEYLLDSSSAKKDLGTLMNKMLNMTKQCGVCSLEGHGMHRKKGSHQEDGKAVTFYSALVTPHLEYCLGLSEQEGHRAAGVGPEEDSEDCQRTRAPLL